jgi:outer membrane receptor protein involved in Fe transport
LSKNKCPTHSNPTEPSSSGAILSLKPLPELAGLIQRGVFPHNIPVVLELHDGRRLIGTLDHCNHVFCADDPVQGLSLGRFINEIANACTDPSITIEAKNLVHDSNGRTYVDLHYANANKTKRSGAELSVDSRFNNNLSVNLAYTLLNAKFDSDFKNSSGNLIASGNRIPGTYRTQVYGEVVWKYDPLGFHAALEGRYNSKVYVDDFNTDTAPSFTVYNLRAGFNQNAKGWRFSEYLRVENISDKEYIASVRINDTPSRFFEPATDRNYLLGLSASYQF